MGRFKLNEEQFRAVLKFKNACDEMQKTGVAVILDKSDYSFKFCNGNEVEYFVDADEHDYYLESIDITDDLDVEELECIIDIDISPNSVYGPRVYCVPKI